MPTITDLPVEVILIILENKCITLEDIENFQSTCKKFQQIILVNKFWEKKILQRYPTAEEQRDKLENFKEQIIAKMKHMEKFMHLIPDNMFCKSNKKKFISLMNSILEDSLMTEYKLVYFFLKERDQIITGLPWMNMVFKRGVYFNQNSIKNLSAKERRIILEYFSQFFYCLYKQFYKNSVFNLFPHD